MDQISKLLILNYLEVNQSIQIFNLLNFTFVKNFGIAFSLFNNESLNASLILVILVSIICIFLFINIFTSIFEKQIALLERCSMAAILSGGIGNLIDRIAYGYVVDFIDISFNPYVFNLADVYVTMGIIMYLLKSFLFANKDESNKVS
ncbi:signal peptidase II [SAR86 cluster bacterium]|nr:signal peptidase II [SAR86 cluster bacterium]